MIGTAGDPVEVLHVIHCLTAGGASRAMVALAVRQALAGVRVRILSLTPSRPQERAQLSGIALDIKDASGMESALSEIARAEVVHVHAWNVPELYEVLCASLPPARLVIWFHVAGRGLPQLIPASLVRRADVAVATCQVTYERFGAVSAPDMLAPRLVHPAAELGRFTALPRQRLSDLTIGYVGRLDEYKLHSDLMSLCARVDAPGVRFVFAGDGPIRASLQRQADALGFGDRVSFLGHVADVGPVLALLDIFGYPMSANSYAAADVAVMEAMAAGVTPVVLAPAGRYDIVRNGIDGVVVATPDEYVAALNRLARDSQERQRLAFAARDIAPVRFDPTSTAAAFADVYGAVLRRAKRPRPALQRETASGDKLTRGAAALLFAFDGGFPELEESLSERCATARLADAKIAEAGAAWLGATSGGLLSYLARFPSDPWLAFWRALNFAGNDLPVRALVWLDRSCAIGFPDLARASAYRGILLELARQALNVSNDRRTGSRFSRALRAHPLPAAL